MEHETYSWGEFRDKVLKRDGYRCKQCGTIPTKSWQHGIGCTDCKDDPLFLRQDIEYREGVCVAIDPSQLIADHIIPIALGGDEWDINNIQTLCIKCNKKKTARDMADIAKLRSVEIVLKQNRRLV
jgi:5-methylcytosine-specific restriction endonuclease McrA